jgi:hypothetical protein
MYKKILPILYSLLLLLSQGLPVYAQESSLATATSVVVAEKGLKDGDIITSTKNGYKRSTIPYDPVLFGVVSLNPAIYLQDLALPNATPIVNLGKANVRVSTISGPIKTRRFHSLLLQLPASEKKFWTTATCIGTAEDEYDEKDPKKIGTILVTLNPHFAQVNSNITKNVFSAFRLGITAAILSPLGALRYIVAAFIAIISFYLGFRFFRPCIKSRS